MLLDKNFLIDSHAHLTFSQYDEKDIDPLGDLVDNNVQGILHIATTMENTAEILEFNKKHTGRDDVVLWATTGVHPSYVTPDMADNIEGLKSQMRSYLDNNPNIVGIGECGLDLFYHQDNLEEQKAVFSAHIELAQEYDKPLIIHNRESDKEVHDLLAYYYNKKPFKAVIHCYTAGIDFFHKVMDMNMLISFSGIVTYKKNVEHIVQAAELVPMENFLVETDAPYLAPQKYRGKVNKSAYVKETAQKVADIKGLPITEIMEHSSNNFLKYFNI